MSTTPEQPTEEELRAAYEEEIRRLRVEHVVLESIVTIINLGMRRSGLLPGTEGERDVGQMQVAIEAVRAQVPLLERIAPEQLPQIRDALSQLQLAFVRVGGQPAPAEAETQTPGETTAPGEPAAPAEPPAPGPGQAPGAEAGPIKPGEPGPAQRSGRLWVPGQ